MRLSPYLLCSLALLFALVLSLCLGAVAIPPLEIVRMALARLPFLRIEPDWAPASETILFEMRLPRAALIAITGAALGGSGAAFQGLFRNPLADSYLIGVASGAGLGAVVAMVCGWPIGTLPASAFLGALATVAVVYHLARMGKTVPVTTLVLAGVAVGSFANALTSLVMMRNQQDLPRIFNFLFGGFALGGWQPVCAALPYVVLGLGSLVLLARPLNVLQFGDEQAIQMGLNVERVKLFLILAASLAAAAAVAISGIIGFVGLVVPHIVRLRWGSDYRRLVPLSILVGAAVLILSETIGRSVNTLRELPVGVITALLGAPFFLYLLRRERKGTW